jgi:hypothetical protein
MTDKGELNEHMLEPNVRGYLRGTPVNKEIRNTLTGDRSINFWLLNNGITVLASKTAKAGYLELTLSDPKIVNGLQTSRELFEYFLTKPKKRDPRKVLIRVIETDDSDLQDAIIRATNRQNSLPKASLRGTDEIQQKIDITLHAADLFYDRKKGFYRDKGKPVAKIVGMPTLAQALLAIERQLPHEARGRPSYFINDDVEYAELFSENKPLNTYLKCIQVLRRVDERLHDFPDLNGTDRSNVIFYTSMLAAVRVTNRKSPTASQIASISLPELTNSFIDKCFERVWKIYEELGPSDAVAKNAEMTNRLRQYINRSIPRRT